MGIGQWAYRRRAVVRMSRIISRVLATVAATVA